MKRNNFLSRFIVVTLTAALLLVSGSRAYRVSALADVVPEVAPVFDTQIYQLQDYIDHGGLGEPQLDVFYIMAGLYAMGQMGSENYTLTNPYANQNGVLNWLKDVGIETYNTLITLAPDTIRLPDGSIMSTDMTKRALSAYIANLMGCAVKAAQYDDVDDFIDDVESSDHYFIPWNSGTQYGLNTMWQQYGGVYQWQFDTQPFAYDGEWRTGYMSDANLATYNNIVSNAQQPLVRSVLTTSTRYNELFYSSNSTNVVPYFFRDYSNLFINTSTNKLYLCKDDGTLYIPSAMIYFSSVFADSIGVYNQTSLSFYTYRNGTSYFSNVPFNLSNYDNKYVNVARAYFNNDFTYNYKIFYQDFIDHVYIGTSWANRTELYNVSDLNIEDSDQPYYVAPPDDTNYLLDIKGILQRILNNTDLYDVFINNIYTPDGVLVHDTDLIRISTRLLQDYEVNNPPIPVNLNDISELTDNTYLDMVKERATNAGSTLANLVAFWHNCDFELVYVLFGAGITVLIGAFIGKWGHS